MRRKGLGRGLGKGYKNMIPLDPYVHSMNARGLSARYVPFKHKGKKYSLEKVKAINLDGSPYLQGYIWKDGKIGSWKSNPDIPYRVQGDEEQQLVSLVKGSLKGREIVFHAKGWKKYQKQGSVGAWRKGDFWIELDKAENYWNVEFTWWGREGLQSTYRHFETKKEAMDFVKKLKEQPERAVTSYESIGFIGNLDAKRIRQLESGDITRLEVEQAITVPSTDYDKPISRERFKERVKEVQTYLAKTFGGETTVSGQGGYVTKTGELIPERVNVVTSFADDEKFEQNVAKLVQKIKKWRDKWNQETIAYQVEDDLYLI